MKRSFVGTCVATALGMALAASAQTPPSPQSVPQERQQPAQAQRPSDDPGKEVKITGCLKAGTEAGTFELATTRKDPKASGEASASASAPSTAAPPAQASASASMSSDRKNVKLVPGAGIDLAAHVGHTVELVGAWDTTASATSPETAGAAKSKQFKVSKVNMISASCAAGTD